MFIFNVFSRQTCLDVEKTQSILSKKYFKKVKSRNLNK